MSLINSIAIEHHTKSERNETAGQDEATRLYGHKLITKLKQTKQDKYTMDPG